MEGTEKIWVYIDSVKVSPESIMLLLDENEFYAEITFSDGEKMKFSRGNYYKHANMFCFSSKDIII